MLRLSQESRHVTLREDTQLMNGRERFVCVILICIMSVGTLLVKDGSHLSHEDFFQNATVLSEEQKKQTEDFYKFQHQERDYFQKFENRALSAKAGSLFLWDSRCAHQNLLPG